MIEYFYGKARSEDNIWGAQKSEKYFFEGTLEKGVEIFDNYVEALVDHIILSKHTEIFVDFGAGSGLREDGSRAWVGWGSKRSRGEDGISRWGECQYKNSKVSTDQVRLYRDVIIFDHVVDKMNVLMLRLPDDAINGFVGEIIHDFVGQSRGHDRAVLCPRG